MKRLVLALCISLLAGAAQAASVFSDDFNGNSSALNATPSGWTVSFGTVDVIGNGFFDFMPGSGSYIDLDGSTRNAGVLTHSLSLVAGNLYTLSFDLAGNHRNSSLEAVGVLFGTQLGLYSLPMNAGWTHYSMNFTPDRSGGYLLSFAALGHDNIGMLLDNVSVTTVPEPETYAMFLAGLGLVGFMARRRKA
jgi:hypothetical protein